MDIIAKIPQIDKMTTFPPTVWYGCYDTGWGDNITSLSYSHPAKVSRGLSIKIYQYALERGWLKIGDTVLDPFGGIGGTCLDALANGLNWIGVELEQRFTDLGQGCECTGITKADWIRFYGRWDKMAHKDGNHWCPQCLAEAKLVTDSRQLSLFEPDPTAAYVRNSGIIPSTQPHYYRGNLDLFKKYAKPGTWAVLLNGDSRRLRQVIGQAQVDGLLSSPPYANGCAHTGGADPNPQHIQGGKRGAYGVNYSQAPDNLGNLPPGSLADSLLSSPPYINSLERSNGIDADKIKRPGGHNSQSVTDPRYGSTDGQLGAMKEGDLDGLVSSPPFTSSIGSDDPDKRGGLFRDPKRRNDRNLTGSYGESEGQLSAMPAGPPPDSSFIIHPSALVSSPPFAGNTGGRGEASRNGIDAALFDRHSGGMKRGTGDDPGNLDHLPMRGFEESIGGLVTSPPFEQGSEGVMRASKFKNPAAFARAQMNKGHGCSFEAKMKAMEADDDRAHYGQTTGQLGIEQGQTFWAAAKDIVSESFLALKPGAYAFFVTKRFVRDGCIVNFTDQWRQLCEACGFEFVEHIQAMLIQSESEQGNLNGDVIYTKKKKSSFFRRLHEKKYPHLAIDNEDVIVMRKPEAAR